MQRMGVDTGGTFTDFVMIIDGVLHIAKRLSTPHNPSTALLAEVAIHTAPEILIHGTTIATNALLERRGAVTALITTAGFRDVLIIGRGDRPSLYDMDQTRPAPLVPDALRLEVNERTTFDQQIITPLVDADVEALFPLLEAHDVQSIAVCLLHAYANPTHEARIGDILRAHNPNWQISLSHQIVNEAREYERTSTTVVNAYVAPIMSHYLHYLATHLPDQTRLRIMASDGGSMGVATAQALPARTTLSGPAGGVVGAYAVATQINIRQIISFDMGGTSTDVALCDGGLPRSSGSAVGELPVRLPSLDIHTVGAGGGSLIRRDAGGALRVGPQSAGAIPGPACYGNGTIATITDANLVLGRLRSDAFLGGAMTLNTKRAASALFDVAQRINTDTIQAALGSIRVINAAMARAVRTISVERGYNPRDFGLVAFGGAGPLHAVHLAQELGMTRVIIPRYPGVLSALGMLSAAVTRSTTRTLQIEFMQLRAAQLNQRIAETTIELTAALLSDGERPESFGHSIYLAMRYRGQAFELDVPLLTNSIGTPQIDESTLHRSQQRFHELHQQRYGHANLTRAIEIAMLRHSMANATTPLPTTQISTRETRCTSVASVLAYPNDDTTAVMTAIHQREHLVPHEVIVGPAVITQLDATTVIPSGWQALVHDTLTLTITPV